MQSYYFRRLFMKPIVYKILGLVCGLCLSLNGFAQVRFEFADTVKFMVKDVSFGTLHEYISIENNTSDTLEMRWIKRPFGRYPSTWDTYFSDPDSTYGIINQIDSGSFLLKPKRDSISHKLIIGIEHKGFSGNARMDFNLFEIGKRQDSARISFAIQVKSLANLEFKSSNFEVYPTHSENGRFFIKALNQNIKNEFFVYDAKGRPILYTLQKFENFTQIQLHTTTKGLYFLQIGKSNPEIIKLIIVE